MTVCCLSKGKEKRSLRETPRDRFSELVTFVEGIHPGHPNRCYWPCRCSISRRSTSSARSCTSAAIRSYGVGRTPTMASWTAATSSGLNAGGTSLVTEFSSSSPAWDGCCVWCSLRGRPRLRRGSTTGIGIRRWRTQRGSRAVHRGLGESGRSWPHPARRADLLRVLWLPGQCHRTDDQSRRHEGRSTRRGDAAPTGYPTVSVAIGQRSDVPGHASSPPVLAHC